MTTVVSLPLGDPGHSSDPPASQRTASTFLSPPAVLEQVVLQIFPTVLINVNCFSCFELRPHWLESPIIDQRGCSFATQFKVMESYSSIYRWKSPAFNHFDCYLSPPLSTRLLQPTATTPRQVQISGSFLLTAHLCSVSVCDHVLHSQSSF